MGLGEWMVVGVEVEVREAQKNSSKCPPHVKVLSTKSRDKTNNPMPQFKFLLPNLGLLSHATLQCEVFGIPLSVSVLY